jgi:ankyrin repeat protein
MWACADGHTETVKVLIEAGADVHDVLPSGFTPLLFAVREGRREVVRALLDAGADPNAVIPSGKGGGSAPPSGTGPLLLAVENAHFELALDLVAAGADPNDQRSGFTPLHAVTWVRKTGLGDDEAGNPAPRGSGAVTSLAFVRRLVELGADVNARLERGSGGPGRMHTKGATAFLFGARSDDLPLLKVLHDLGADPSLPNIDGCTPLMAAAGIGTLAPGEEAGTEPEALETVAWLLELGADPNVVDRNGETAMHGAAYKSLPKMVRFLDANGADIAIWNRRNKHGWTPLVIAQGFRPGNFKPAEETIAALSEVMRSHGLEPPPPPPRDNSPREYER